MEAYLLRASALRTEGTETPDGGTEAPDGGDGGTGSINEATEMR
jgi:hypothetical protein